MSHEVCGTDTCGSRPAVHALALKGTAGGDFVELTLVIRRRKKCLVAMENRLIAIAVAPYTVRHYHYREARCDEPVRKRKDRIASGPDRDWERT